jgi:hypothetical protein
VGRPVQRIIAALTEFGFGHLGLSAGDFEQAGVVVQLGREPQRIDILTFATGLDFPEAASRFLPSTNVDLYERKG